MNLTVCQRLSFVHYPVASNERLRFPPSLFKPTADLDVSFVQNAIGLSRPPEPILVGASDWIDMITSTGVGESGAQESGAA